MNIQSSSSNLSHLAVNPSSLHTLITRSRTGEPRVYHPLENPILIEQTAPSKTSAEGETLWMVRGMQEEKGTWEGPTVGTLQAVLPFSSFPRRGVGPLPVKQPQQRWGHELLILQCQGNIFTQNSAPFSQSAVLVAPLCPGSCTNLPGEDRAQRILGEPAQSKGVRWSNSAPKHKELVTLGSLPRTGGALAWVLPAPSDPPCGFAEV